MSEILIILCFIEHEFLLLPVLYTREILNTESLGEIEFLILNLLMAEINITHELLLNEKGIDMENMSIVIILFINELGERINQTENEI
jgi:hypothetical protein